MRADLASGALARTRFVDLGDEISVGQGVPEGAAELAAFRAWLPAHDPAIDPAAARFVARPDEDPRLFHATRRFAMDRGIAALRARTDILRAVLGSDVYAGANFSAHPEFFPYAGQWIRLFRDGGLTLPWAEDYVFQVPELSPIATTWIVDALRAGARDRRGPGRDLPILFAPMSHSPGNTPRDFTLSAYGALGHGARGLYLFSAASRYDYTENYVAWEDLPMWRAIRQLAHDVAQADDLLAAGRVRPARVAMIVSETNDLWETGRRLTIWNSERKLLHAALRLTGVALDLVEEEDIARGALGGYDAAYLIGDHLRRDVGERIAEWVEAGGRLYAGPGAGLLDQVNEPNPAMHRLLGVRAEKLRIATPRCPAKECLAFLEPLALIRLSPDLEPSPALGATARIVLSDDLDVVPEVLQRFSGGEPAMVLRKIGDGTVVHAAFLLGFSIFHPAIPRRPFDRGTTDAAFNHFLPTRLDRAALALAHAPVHGTERPLRIARADRSPDRAPHQREGEPDLLLVDASVIDAPGGHVVVLVNHGATRRERLDVWLRSDSTSFREVYGARCGPLKPTLEPDGLRVTLPLGDAELVVFRR